MTHLNPCKPQQKNGVFYGPIEINGEKKARWKCLRLILLNVIVHGGYAGVNESF